MSRHLITLLLLIALISCEQPVNLRPPLLLAQRAKPDMVWEALVIGTLELRGRCIVVRQANNSEATVIWPAGTRFEDSGARPRIVVSDEHIFQIGEQVTFGGGEISKLDPIWQAFLPSEANNCPAPYWVAHGI